MDENGTDAEDEALRTDSGYAVQSRKNGELTPAAEDYLEMIFRLSCAGKETPVPVRIGELAEKLRVSPSSASRMAQTMALWGYLDFRRYGYITMTEKGRERGAYFVRRHRAVREFLEELTGRDALVETERIEHHLSEETVLAMERRGREERMERRNGETEREKGEGDE